MKRFNKKKGDYLMINKINKKLIIILLFTMIFTILFPREVNAATYNTRNSLYNAGKNAVGNTVRIWREGRPDGQDAFGQLHARSEIYCVQHDYTITDKNKYRDYTVKSYIKISGNVATNSSGQRVSSEKNLALAYLISQEDSIRKGYSGSGMEQLRNLAIKHYLTTGGWMAEVGTKLGMKSSDISNFNINNYAKNKRLKEAVQAFVNRAISYSKTNPGAKMPATMKLSPSSIQPSTMKELGPIKIDFTGNLQSIKLFNGNKEVKDSKTYKVNGKTKTLNQIATGNRVTIGKNTENVVTKVEATSKSNSYIEAQLWLCITSKAKQNLMIATSATKSDTATSSVKVNELQKGELTINKIDADTKKALSAGFKIQTSAGKWLSGSNGTYNYNSSFANAQEYKSPVTLKGLKFDTYKVYEVRAPKGYDLKAQTGYNKTNNWVYFGTATLNANNKKVQKTFSNMQKISIKGYVWIDTQPTKDGPFNSQYDSTRESKVAGVTVRLMKKGNTSTKVPTTTTNTNGEYVFDKVLSKSELKDYYVEFDYSKLDNLKTTYKDAEGKEHKYINYIPVAFNSTDVSKIVANGSRALMDNVPVDDVNLKGIATTYKGKEKERIYGLSGNLCDKLLEGSVLNNINLGIKKIQETDHHTEEVLDYVRIVMRGYSYTYKYGNAGKATYVTAPNVNWQKVGTISGYTANIYPSDIAYDKENNTEELKVYVGYKINITNTTTTGTGSVANNYKELYNEKALHVTNLTDTFDSKRYTLADDNWEKATDKNGVSTTKYNKDIKAINSGKTEAIKIKFNVKHEAIMDILNHPYGIIEKYPTTAKTEGYHEYTRTDYGWNYNIAKEQTHKISDNPQEGSAPYLIFKLSENTRKISGRVFKDERTDSAKANNEVLGDGVDNNEKGVAGVKVQLLDVSVKDNKEITDITKLPVSGLYDVPNNNGTRTTISKDAEVLTDANGIYKLEGIVPGDYYLRFVYGNGEYKITDIDGKVISEGTINSKIDDKEIDAKNYKSTIVVNSVAKKALQGIKDGETIKVDEVITEGTNKKENYIWYKNLKATNASIAIDTLGTRIGVNENNLKNIISGTAKFSITLENDVNNSTDVKDTSKEADKTQAITDGEKTNNKMKVNYLNAIDEKHNDFNGLNLGIIEMPEQRATIEKIITNIKLVNAQGNLVFQGNPETDSLTGVSDLDHTKNGGSTYVRAELQDDMISGAILQLTYAIHVTNTSDVNYYNEEYYFYGDKKDGKKEVTLVLNELVDYLDKTLSYNQDASTSKFVEVTDLTNLPQDEELKDKIVLELKGLNEKLYTTMNKSRQTTDNYSASLVAQRSLSLQDDDMEFINIAKVRADRGTAKGDDSEQSNKEIKTVRPYEFKDYAQAKATITPPTGADRQTIIIYTIAGTIALAVLSAGVFVIKKYIVK